MHRRSTTARSPGFNSLLLQLFCLPVRQTSCRATLEAFESRVWTVGGGEAKIALLPFPASFRLLCGRILTSYRRSKRPEGFPSSRDDVWLAKRRSPSPSSSLRRSFAPSVSSSLTVAQIGALFVPFPFAAGDPALDAASRLTFSHSSRPGFRRTTLATYLLPQQYRAVHSLQQGADRKTQSC